ncbi:hypothetical protein JW964_08320, partial [candidate division KSB1 bacterium]|nr:hypothetical protein [candidate division KSB1 bacterium]
QKLINFLTKCILRINDTNKSIWSMTAKLIGEYLQFSLKKVSNSLKQYKFALFYLHWNFKQFF